MDSLSVGIPVPSIDCDGETWTQVNTDPRDDLFFPDALPSCLAEGGRDQIGMVAAIKSVGSPRSGRNGGRDQIGIPGRLALESAAWQGSVVALTA